MTIISVDARGELRVDGEPKKVADLTQEFLEKLVDDSLESKVEYEIEGDMPLAGFFEKLRDGTKEGSELRKAKEECEKRAGDAVAAGKRYIEEHGDVPLSDVKK
ncbi:MAG TPA: hypothetical protein OIL88_06710 [Coriobacteriaceae bacterium]|uniref:hypothetical protein n=1 Tax=Collinsella sp. AF31-11 TaxID=2292011 RepID=UPI000E526A64|nr:hypothetical protein [Collinsella sp. AF31-11]RHN22477.1 hypothetical protein DWZ22_04735 [Collinsella sp. AF31-11]HJI72053.1 hypothetical protein [Coriobacteriaceae bacterium]